MTMPSGSPEALTRKGQKDGINAGDEKQEARAKVLKLKLQGRQGQRFYRVNIRRQCKFRSLEAARPTQECAIFVMMLMAC